ncbi:MAG TPA: hypothetical protein VM253_06555 [Candidatus Limnocylindrales bacterium]|nr:hypothetical protein [Candidatus Limnocylindrales bacterium]
MTSTILIHALTTALAIGFAVLVADQWLRRRQPYQLVWALGLVWYGIAAGTELLGAATGWNELLYRAWYLTGAVWVAAWLGLGTIYLLARTRFGFAFAASLLLAGLFTYLTQQRYEYANAGIAPAVYVAVAAVAAVAITVLSWRRSEAWAHVAAGVIVAGTLASGLMMAAVSLPAPGYAIDPATGAPTGELFPGYLRLLTPFFNISGAFALVLGAIYSAYVFMPKRRVIGYSVRADQPLVARIGSILVAPVAIAVNLVASLPEAVVALLRGRLNSRVPATLLIAAGGMVVSVTSGLGRFGETSAHAIGLLVGLLLIFLGFLVSIEVFSDVRLPFTRIVLRRRDRGGQPAG